MNYEVSVLAIVLFLAFVCFVVGISFYLGSRTKSADGYYAAGGTIHWAVNGVAFAGDYLSAASFLGICGMIATKGYDGFLYSIGYLAGWMVALFLVAEPMKRLGKYTFTDALDCKFNAKSIQLTAAISTLIVSIFYLIPQMVGAGVLVEPLLGFPHWVGVVFVGIIVTIIVATAGMASTTYVQFLKGGLLLVFSFVLVVSILTRGLKIDPDAGGDTPYHKFTTIQATVAGDTVTIDDPAYKVLSQPGDAFIKEGYVMLNKDGINSIWKIKAKEGKLEETLSKASLADGTVLYNGAPKEDKRFFKVGSASKIIVNGKSVSQTGAVGPFEFLKNVRESEIVLWGKKRIIDAGNTYDIYYQKPTPGDKILRPGMKFKIEGTFVDKLNFVSLMLALFCGTAALPHILIRYYTVPSQADARKSTIVAIAAIGFFYILTLFMGIGAMTNGVINVLDNNMSAPLVALSFGVVLFAIISSIAFSTVLGTVSGLIVAASGAVAHDLLNNFLGVDFDEAGKVRAGKIAAIVVGAIAILLGIAFKGMNVSFLVGWAFAVAASANLPSIVMILFWKRTTYQGISASIIVGIVSSLGIILLSPSMYVKYGLLAKNAPWALDNPGIVSIPLSFIALVVVSLMTEGVGKTDEELEAEDA
ncbi:MAG: cation acetate symporter [Gammaproteobacteria bacterium]|nr:MAG: cation acetate symporter [Gammaproteobacteria bacterium]